MAINKKLLLYFFSSLIVLGCFFVFDKVKAAEESTFFSHSCGRHGRNDSKSCDDSFSANNVDYQMFKVRLSGDYHGHGGTSKVKITVCFSQFYNSFFTGHCDFAFPQQDVPDTGGQWRPLCELNGSWCGSPGYVYEPEFGSEIDYNYAVIGIYVMDAEARVTGNVYGRRVSIDSFNAPESAEVNQSFAVDWDTDWAVNDMVLSWDGAVGSGEETISGGQRDIGSRSFTATSGGQAYFTLRAAGPGRNGVTTVTEERTVNVASAGPGPFTLNNATCQSGQVDLSWSSSSGASNYEVWQRFWSSGSWSRIANTGGTNYTDYPPADTDTYYYIKATNSGGSINSNDYTNPYPPGPYVRANEDKLVSVNCPTAQSVIQVTSNVATSWTINPGNITGSGTSMNHTVAPGTYTITAAPVGGYNGPNYDTPQTQTVFAGGSINFSLSYTPAISCVDDASITLTQSVPATVAPNTNYTFGVRVNNTGNTNWYHGSAYQLLQTSGFNIDPSYGALPYEIGPGGDAPLGTFTLTTPSTAGTYTLTMRMIHRAGWQYIKAAGGTCSGPGSDIYFGQTVNMTFTVDATRSIVFNVNYTPATLEAPVITSVDNSVCGRLTANWTHNNPGNTGQNFSVWRSSTGAAGSFSQIASSLPIAQRSYQDTPPVADQSYYYIVKVHTNIGGNREASSNTFGPTLNRPCSSLLSGSMSIYRVNGQVYSQSTALKDGDVLTIVMTLRNQGNVNATINYIDHALSTNLTNPRNSSTQNSPNSIRNPSVTPTAGGFRHGVSGSKCYDGSPGCTNWLIYFDVTIDSNSNDPLEVISDTATVNYTDPLGTRNLTVRFGPMLIKSGGAKVPDIKEVAP